MVSVFVVAWFRCPIHCGIHGNRRCGRVVLWCKQVYVLGCYLLWHKATPSHSLVSGPPPASIFKNAKLEDYEL